MKQIQREKKEFRLIGQGSYGCAYRPSIRCNDQTVGSAHFLSKVQFKDKNSAFEMKMGEIVKTIPAYQQFFAPIVEQCPINISKIENSELQNCEVIKGRVGGKKEPEYVSSKIRYVGQETLDDYFHKVLKPSRTPLLTLQKYWKVVGNSHLYLLNSVHLLNKKGVLHLDLKGNNVMLDHIQKAFVIIDFGLSYETKNLNRENYAKYGQKPFGCNIDSYITWPIEMNILSYISRLVQGPTETELKTEIWSKKVENVAELKTVCNKFIKHNNLLQDDLFSTDERKDLYERIHKWVEGMRGKTWGEIWDVVAKTHLSWDAYGLSSMYLLELKLTNVVSYLQELPELKRADPQLQKQAVNTVTQIVTGKNPQETHHTYFMREYVKCLKRHVLSDPETRSHTEQIRGEIQTIFNKIDRFSYDVMNEQMAPKIFHSKTQKQMEKAKKENTVRELTVDKQLRKAYNSV